MNEEYVTKRVPEWKPPEMDLPDGVEFSCYVVSAGRS